MIVQAPADDLPAEHVQNDREVQKARPRRDVRDVGDPQAVRSLRFEPSIDQIGCGPPVGVPLRRRHELAPVDATEAGTPHQPGNPLPRDSHTLLSKLLVDPRTSVGPPRRLVGRPDLAQQYFVPPSPLRRTPLEPRVVPARGDLEYAAQRGHLVFCPVRAHELEDPDGSFPVSRANQAVAFARIARSSRSERTSRRSWRSSSRSALVRPSSPAPPSRSACRTQFRMACDDGSYSSASDSGLRPAATSATSRRRSSGEYGGLLFGIVSSSSSIKDSTKPGQLHPNHVWSYDFIFDRTHDGRRLKILAVVDEFTRECLALRAARSFQSGDVQDVLRDLMAERGRPAHLRSDNGPEFIASELRRWLGRIRVGTLFIAPGSPWESAYVESFNSRLRDELLNGEEFSTLFEANVLLEMYRVQHNEIRPHRGLGRRTPSEFAATQRTQRAYPPGPGSRDNHTYQPRLS